MRSTLITATFTAISCSGLVCESVNALPPFKKAFQEKYTDKEANKEFYDLVRKTNCNICHVAGEKDRSKQNAYGTLLNQEIPGDAKERIDTAKQNGQSKEEMEKLLKEIDQAFDKVAKKEKEKGQTWGEIIRSGQLPVPPRPQDNEVEDGDEESTAEQSEPNSNS